MLRALAIRRGLGRCLRDERGSAVVDQLPVLMAVIFLVMLIFEVGLAYFLQLGTAKAAQLGARVAVTLPPLHPGVPEANLPNGAYGQSGDTCFQPIGRDACADPGGPWVCDGALPDACDGAGFARVVAEMRRTYPRLTRQDVVITYAYRRLGVVGGPFVPEVNVTVRPQSYKFLTLLVSEAAGVLADRASVTFAGASASAFGEHMRAGG